MIDVGSIKKYLAVHCILRNGLEIKTNSCGEEMNDLTYFRF